MVHLQSHVSTRGMNTTPMWRARLQKCERAAKLPCFDLVFAVTHGDGRPDSLCANLHIPMCGFLSVQICTLLCSDAPVCKFAHLNNHSEKCANLHTPL